VRVLIGEDEALLRDGLSLVLQRGGFEVIAAVGTARELVEQTRQHAPDLVVTDIRMPPSFTDEGLLAALEIRGSQPAVPLVVLSQHLQRRYALELLAQPTAGTGYLLKQRIADTRTFCHDLRRVSQGGTVLDPEVVQLMMSRARSEHDTMDRLTERQREVLELMAQGRSNAWIARSLSITEKSVVQHVSHIYDELGLQLDTDDHRRVLAVVRFLSR
jgi:DNA-binding NarL/FixJ family response regulator